MTPKGLHYWYPVERLAQPETVEVDLCVYGGTSGGIATAVHAARQGKKVALLVFNRHLGGLTTGGLGCTDVGNKAAFGGIAREFYQRIGAKYGQPEQWAFEPHVASAVFDEILEWTKVQVYVEHRLSGLQKDGARITRLDTEIGRSFRAAVFVDCSYEGDLLPAAGVSHTVGREGIDVYDEFYTGKFIGDKNHRFRVFVDPYRTPGQPSSGLAPLVTDDPIGTQGEGDDELQAYNFRLCLTQAEDRLPFFAPDGYNRQRYTLLERYLKNGGDDGVQVYRMMPNGKTDTNNEGGFSTDNIGRSKGFPEADYARREAMFQDHVNHAAGMYHFLANDPEVPEATQAKVRSWGYAADEFPRTGGFPEQLYMREARRMVSDYVVTEHDIFHRFEVEDPVGMGAYQMDSHHCRRVVFNGYAFNEGNVEVAVHRPYGISYRAIRPKKSECENLLVPWCVSASHVAFGSIRMEPVFMALGEAAAEAAILAMDRKQAVQDVDYGALRERLDAVGHASEFDPSRSEAVYNPHF